MYGIKKYESHNKLGLCPNKEQLRMIRKGDTVKINCGSKDNNGG
jgi:methionine aminopeptidase